MIELRKATMDDLPAVMPMLREFNEESIAEYGLGYDEKSAQNTVEVFIKQQVGLVVEKDGEIIGCIGGVLAPHFLCYSTTIFQEAIWFVKKEHRGGSTGLKLLELVEEYCDNNGWRLVMVNMANLNNEKMKSFYTKRGYQFMESQFLKGAKNA